MVLVMVNMRFRRSTKKKTKKTKKTKKGCDDHEDKLLRVSHDDKR